MAKILIAEDDPTMTKVLSNALREAGFEVDTAVDGAETLKKIKDNQYALLLLDLVMPERTGFEVLHELKLLKIDVPIVVFSNLFEESSKKEAIDLGAKAYYVKSDISIEKLVEIVKKFVKS